MNVRAGGAGFVACVMLAACAFSQTAPWPMFGRDSSHTGNAGDGPFEPVTVPALGWSYQGGSIGSSFAVGSDGTVYHGTDSNRICAVGSDGAFLWSHLIGDLPGEGIALDASGTVYAGSLDNRLRALASDGTLNWSYAAAADITGGPAIASDGRIYFGSSGGTTASRIHCLLSSGALS